MLSRNRAFVCSSVLRSRVHHLQFTAACILVFLGHTVLPGGFTPRRIPPTNHHQKETLEILDVLSMSSPDVKPQSQLPIDAIHRQGLPHKGSWMFLVDDYLRVLLLWRSPQMVTCPNSWSLCGEHALAGESFEAAAHRGLAEEAPFLGEPLLYPLGKPFMFTQNYGGAGNRTDNQWTRSYLALSSVFQVDFSLIASEGHAFRGVNESAMGDSSALNIPGATENRTEYVALPENTRFQGMPLADVVRTSVRNVDYFCSETQRMWLLRTLSLLARVLREKRPAKYRKHLAQEWTHLEQSGAPICCASSEDRNKYDQVDLSECGIPCHSQPRP